MASATELLPCPFCGGEAEVYEMQYGENGKYSVFGVFCVNDSKAELIGLSRYQHGHFIDNYPTEAEAVEAWNTRAPIEYDGWFYLPKPKEGFVDYGEPEITKTENGYKVRQAVDVIDQAARKWGDELGEYVMKRVCEAWNTRHVETCHSIDPVDSGEFFICSNCNFGAGRIEFIPNFCPSCGRKVVGA